jgi:hypothetical protein
VFSLRSVPWLYISDNKAACASGGNIKLLVSFLDIHGNDVHISIETVETLEETENNSDGLGSCDSSEEICADKSTQQEYLPSPKKQKTEIAFSDKERAGFDMSDQNIPL